jgi:lipoprotein-anchoring transpeptidase ErfK/SrfK
MRLLASLGSLKCVCRLVTTFFLLALLIFPAAAEPAPPPISGSNGLMGDWGANSSAPQTGSSTDLSGKPISGSNDQQGTTAPGTPKESNPPSADAQDTPSAPPNVAPSPSARSGSEGSMEEWGTSGSAAQTGSSTDLSEKPISGSSDQQGTTSPGTPSESSPPSAPPNVAPSPSAQSGSNGLIEWGANSSAPQTGSSTDLSGKPISGSKDQQGTTAPGTSTESSPLSADAQDTELGSSPPSAHVAPSPSAHSGSNGLIEWGASGLAAQTGSSAHTSGRAFKVPNGDATLQSDPVAPDTQTELSPLSAPPEQSLEATAPPASKVLVIIDKPTQKMKVFVDDVELYSWKVSSGLPGYATPSGTYTASSMNEIWYSKEWDDAPMPHAVFFTKKGHAIHGTQETKKLGRPASHGCVRLAPEDARTLFALVKEKGLENTEIVLNGDTPGGDSRMARSKQRKQQVKQAKTRVYAAPGRREFEKPRRFGRRGWFQRRFSGSWRY